MQPPAVVEGQPLLDERDREVQPSGRETNLVLSVTCHNYNSCASWSRDPAIVHVSDHVTFFT